MTTRMISPDRKCISVDVGPTRYNGTSFDVSNPGHASMLRQAGYIDAGPGGSTIRATGYVCTDCGFRALFRSCSRCGGTCERPTIPPAPAD